MSWPLWLLILAAPAGFLWGFGRAAGDDFRRLARRRPHAARGDRVSSEYDGCDTTTLVYVDAGRVKLALASPDGDTFEVWLPVESARNLAAGLVVAADEVEADDEPELNAELP